MLNIDLKVPGGLGGAYVWAVKDDDAGEKCRSTTPLCSTQDDRVFWMADEPI